MQLNNRDALLYIPEGAGESDALPRTNILCITAHQDDVEIMAMSSILDCFGKPDKQFGAVVVTNGAGSPRSGSYSNFTDEQMQKVRQREQCNAALLGGYSFAALLMYPSSAVKDPASTAPAEELAALLRAARPEIVITHNPADKHDTHVAVLSQTVRAIRMLEPELRPKHLLAGECWRGLDWVPDAHKTVAAIRGHDNLASALVGLFDSQVSGGKRYDLAVMGRWRANATFLASHNVDTVDLAGYYIDMSALVRDDTLTLSAYMDGLFDSFRDEVGERLSKYTLG